MSISFGTKIPTFLNILVLRKVVGIILDHASTYSQLKIRESSHIEQSVKPELNKQVEHVSLSLHF